MKKTIKIVLIGIVIVALAFVAWPHKAVTSENEESTVPAEIEPPKPKLTHRQEVWLYALEWCECHAVHTAINEVDLDGTPSYYAFQFKPGTFRSYGEIYEVIPKGLTQEEIMELLKSYELQREIVKNMILDPSIKWTQQFPGCVKKLGLPPKD